jgi:hypothetical protein
MCSSSPPPAPSNITQTTIPEYAKPYVETLLGKAEALTDVTKSPYQTYGGERIAGQSQEQKDITTDILAQTMPGQFATGTNLASTAGLAALGAGSDYAKMATRSAEQAKYMSPYMQNVVEIQKQEAIRDAQRGKLAQNLAAARQGTYGGSRQLLSRWSVKEIWEINWLKFKPLDLSRPMTEHNKQCSLELRQDSKALKPLLRQGLH